MSREALALWRGEPLPEVAYEPFAQAEIARLHELRLAALEERVEADLILGRHLALVPELETLVAGHPLRERLRSHLMLALYRCHRQADALEAYQQGRRLLVDELGLEPGERLQALERVILNHDPSLELEPAPPRNSPVTIAAVASGRSHASSARSKSAAARRSSPRPCRLRSHRRNLGAPCACRSSPPLPRSF